MQRLNHPVKSNRGFTKLMLLIITVLMLLPIVSPMKANANEKKGSLLYDFGSNGCGVCDWFVLVDGVMGGRSTGELSVSSNSAALAGSISLANNGGFSSIRTPYQTFDLSGYSEVVVRYRSTAQSFALTLSKYRRFWKPRFKAELSATDGEWTEKTLRMGSFKNMRFDEVVGGGPTSGDLSKIIRLGFISNTKKAGEFVFELDFIRFQ